MTILIEKLIDLMDFSGTTKKLTATNPKNGWLPTVIEEGFKLCK